MASSHGWGALGVEQAVWETPTPGWSLEGLYPTGLLTRISPTSGVIGDARGANAQLGEAPLQTRWCTAGGSYWEGLLKPAAGPRGIEPFSSHDGYSCESFTDFLVAMPVARAPRNPSRTTPLLDTLPGLQPPAPTRTLTAASIAIVIGGEQEPTTTTSRWGTLIPDQARGAAKGWHRIWELKGT